MAKLNVDSQNFVIYIAVFDMKDIKMAIKLSLAAQV